MPEKEYFSVNEVAKRLEIHRETVLRAIRAKQLRAVKIGQGLRITESDIADYEKKRTVGVE